MDGADTKDVTSTCPSGTALVSGGYHMTPTTPQLVAFTDEPNGANGWHVQAGENGLPNSTDWSLTVFALCAVPPPTPR
jgi:hypothetical protein